MKHIRIINPFVDNENSLEKFEQEVNQRYGRDDLKLSVAVPDRGLVLESHESLTNLSLSVPELIRNALKAEDEGVKGIVINCMADPGVEVLRENVSIPVLGPGHASMYAAAMLGHRFSLIVTSDYSERYFLQHAHRAGLHSRLASCHAVNIPPDELTTDPAYTVELLGEVAREAVVEAGADTLILGCTNFCFLIDEIQEKLKAEKLDVLIIDPFSVSINMLAALIDAGLTQSKIAYPNAGISRSDGIPGVNLSA